jgi:glycosyltransferase involved in cell wall biosynthesis
VKADELLVSVVVPLRNEGALLEQFLHDLSGVLSANYRHYEIVLVDDGSEDDTAARIEILLARYDHVRFLRLSRHFGEETAILAGLESIIGDYAVVMQPRSDPPALVPGLVGRALDGFDIVYGVRLSRSDQPVWYRAATKVFYFYASRIARLNLPADTTQFRCLSRSVVNALTKLRTPDPYLRLLTWNLGFNKTAFPYRLTTSTREAPRRLGGSIRLAVSMIAENSAHPLRAMTWLGLFATLMNVVYAFYVVLIYLFKPRVAEGWVTLSLQAALQFFVISLILTVLSEYTGRLFLRTLPRSPYILAGERNSSVIDAESSRNVVSETALQSGSATARSES